MFGWLSAASVCASRLKRASRSGSFANESGQNFERDIAIESRVARAIDLAHSAFANLGRDFVDAETGAGDERQCGAIIPAAPECPRDWFSGSERNYERFPRRSEKAADELAAGPQIAPANR